MNMGGMVVVLPISWTYCMMIYSVRRGESLTRQAMHKRYHRIVESLGIDATVHALRHPYVKPMTKIILTVGNPKLSALG